ncbi:MAG: hypothetical protein R3B84_19785 [Zavarzinella sp.]
MLLLVLPASACQWDEDTLMMERVRFPSTMELLTGRFVRHSEKYYTWRIEDRLKKLQQDPNNLEFLDDLAVAYEKTGQTDLAIATARKMLELQQDRYETLANLGTFYVHAGKLEEGAKWIQKAIEINPDAHFGREKYQLYLVQYLISIPPDQTAFSNQNGLLKALHVNDIADRGPAIKGVLGMMRFGNYRSPVLLYTLGTLLANYHVGYQPESDAKLLAGRAFLLAAKYTPSAKDQETLRYLATNILQEQYREGTTIPVTLEEIEQQLETELLEAEKWYEELRTKELQWLNDGLDVNAMFARLLRHEQLRDSATYVKMVNTKLEVGKVVVIAILTILLTLWWRRLRNRRLALHRT